MCCNVALLLGWLVTQQKHKQQWPTDRLYHMLCTLPPSDIRAHCRQTSAQPKKTKKRLKGESTERPCPNPSCDLLWSPEARSDRRLKGSQACTVGGRHHLSLKMAVHSGHRLCKIHSTCTFTHSIHWVV